jgi:hypothetical protein
MLSVVVAEKLSIIHAKRLVIYDFSVPDYQSNSTGNLFFCWLWDAQPEWVLLQLSDKKAAYRWFPHLLLFQP